jgi:hypothetical protein
VRWFAVLLMLTGTAIAEPDAAEPREPSSPTEPTARDVRGAPAPGQESGRTDHEQDDETVARKLARGLLFVPRVGFQAVAAPIGGAIYLQDRYSVSSKVTDSFQTEDKKLAVYPTAFAETGFGLNVGGRVKTTDLIAGETFSGRVGFGGQFRWIADLGLSRRFGPVGVALEGRREARDNDRFFGYGNADRGTPDMPMDPLNNEVAVSTRFRSRMLRGLARVSVDLPSNFSLVATSAVVRRTFDVTDDEDSIDQFFQVDQLPGFMTDTTYLHDELQLAWDSRRRASKWDAHGVRSSGSLLLGFADYEHGLTNEPDFLRYGVDLQRYFRLTEGPRVLELRFYGEAVTGARDEVPFSELPRLGGSNVLRGYESGRFRDRIAAVGQVRYLWSALAWLSPSLFVDTGRVWSGYDDLSLDGLRVGFGGGIETYSRAGLTMRAELATSIDGGIFAFLSFQPVFDSRMEHQ